MKAKQRQNGSSKIRTMSSVGVTVIVVGLVAAYTAMTCWAPDNTIGEKAANALPRHAVARLGGNRFVSSGDTVNLLAYSRDGKRLASLASGYAGNSRPGIQVWDVTTGREVGPADLADRDADWLDWSPDGKHLVLCGTEGRVEVWNVAAASRVRVLTDEGERRFRCVAWSRDGNWIAACQPDGTTYVWRAAGDWQRRDLKSAASRLAISPDAKSLVTASERRVVVWNLAAGEMRHKFKLRWRPEPRTETADADTGLESPSAPRTPWLCCLAVSPDSKLLAVGGNDRLEMRELSTGKLTDSVDDVSTFDIAFRADGTRLVTTSIGDPTRLWEIMQDKTLRAIREFEPAGFAAAFSPDGKQMALATRRICLVDSETGIPTEAFAAHAGMIRVARFTNDGQSVLTSAAEGTVRQWDATTRRQIRRLDLPEGLKGLLAISADEKTAASSDAQDNVVVWNLKTGRRQATVPGHGRYQIAAAFSPKQERLATMAVDGTVCLWDTHNDRLLASWKHPQEQPFAGEIAFAPDGRMFAASFPAENKIRLYDVDRPAVLRTIAADSSLFWLSFAFSSDATVVATTSGNKVDFVDAATGRTIRSMTGRFDLITRVACSRDGRLVAAAGQDAQRKNVIRVWSADNGRTLLKLSGHDDWICSLAFSPSGEMIVSGSQDSTILVWDVRAARKKLAAKLNVSGN